VCRGISAKTNEFYGRTAFRRLSIHPNYQALQRLTEISQHNAFASKVELLSISTYDRATGSREEYEQAQVDAASLTLPRRQHREAEAPLWRAHREQDDKAFVERSAADAILLTLALQRMSNVHKVLIHSVDTRDD